MKKGVTKWLWLIVSLLVFSAQGEAEKLHLFADELRYEMTDDLGQSVTDLAKANWQSHELPGMPLGKRNVWLRATFTVEQKPHSPLGIFIAMLGSYQAYWDGQLIGTNGSIGQSKEEEVAGQIESVFYIPAPLLKPGEHELLLRVSNHYVPEDTASGMFWTSIGDYPTMVNFSFSANTLPMVMFGAFLFIAMYCGFLFIKVERELRYLFFALLNVSVLLLFVAESWRGLWGYTYDWHIPRLDIVLALSTLVSFLLTLFFIFLFNFSLRVKSVAIGAAILGLVSVLVFIEGYDNRSLCVVMVGFSVSFGLTLIAAWQKQTHARLMSMGLMLCIAPLLLNTHRYMEQYFFVAFSILIMLLLYTLSQTMRAKQSQLLESQLTASRLELELVKRNLQPHFMLNTLTAIEEWIEQSPKTAVTFIQALAEEFRQLSKMSHKKLITLSEEVALCRSHFQLMGFRHDLAFEFDTSISLPESLIPPGVLLTLVENAMTHNNYQDLQTPFTLAQTIQDGRTTLIFSAPLRLTEKQHALRTQTGSNYIKARLQESFAVDWVFSESEEKGCWVSRLSFPVKLGAGD